MNDTKKYVGFDPARIKRMARDRVLFRRDRTPNTVGSLYLPDTARYIDRADGATVIAVGIDVTEVKVGDRLLLPDILDVRGKFTGPDGDTYTVVDRTQLGQVAVVDP